MPTIRIHRKDQSFSVVRDYKIYLDNRKIGEIGKGDTKEFNIPGGRHELFAKLDWLETERIILDLEQDEEQEVILKASKVAKFSMLFLFLLPFIYYLVEFELKLLLVLLIPPLLFLIFTLTYGKRSFIEFEQTAN